MIFNHGYVREIFDLFSTMQIPPIFVELNDTTQSDDASENRNKSKSRRKGEQYFFTETFHSFKGIVSIVPCGFPLVAQ
jgi:hypothetical protein